MITLYREIDALGGYYDPDDAAALARSEQLREVLEILTKRGFTEQADAAPLLYDDMKALLGDMVRKQEMDIDHYLEAERIYKAVTPVDPDLIEARKIAAVNSNSASVDHCDYLRGICDNFPETKAALAALKRGRELAVQS